MKRRIIVLFVMVFSVFVLIQPSTVATSACDCWCDCDWYANICFQNCDQEYPNAPFLRRDCQDQCFWEHETCTWHCHG